MKIYIFIITTFFAIGTLVEGSLSENQLVALPNKVNQAQAINLCKSQGMNLVKIQDEGTNQMVYNFAVHRKLGQYWIDANDRQSEGNWVYNDGNRIVYSKWHSGEPNNYGKKEHCLHGLFYQNGFWNDIDCNIQIAVICYHDRPMTDIQTFEEHQLLALPNKVNHQQAVSLCKEQGMNLVKIQDEKTNQMVFNFAVKRGLGQYWMDANDKHSEGNWVYEDGNRIVYSKWHSGEPNNYGRNEHCLHGLFYQNGFWNDINCDVKISVICYRNKPLAELVNFEENQLVALPNKVNQQQAVSLCKQQGMNLVKIQSEKTNQIVYNFAVQKGLGQYWMDANDRHSEGSWVHEDGNRIVYSKWQSGEPNNYGNNEHCLHGLFYQNGFWNDINCNINNAVICYKDSATTEIEIEPKPKPKPKPQTETETVTETISVYLTDEKGTYDEAVEYCKSQDLRLIRMESEDLNKLVYDMAKNKNLGSYWIDGTDIKEQGKWLYSDGSALKYKNFKGGESSGNGHCLNVEQSEGMTWNIVQCDSKNVVICF